MTNLILKIVMNGVAIGVATAVLDGVTVSDDELGHKIVTLLIVGLIFGVVNAFIKPIVKLFTLPFYILSLGLFSFVVNALMLEIVAWVLDQVDPTSLNISFTIDDFFWSAILAALIVTFVSMVLNLVLPDTD